MPKFDIQQKCAAVRKYRGKICTAKQRKDLITMCRIGRHVSGIQRRAEQPKADQAEAYVKQMRGCRAQMRYTTVFLHRTPSFSVFFFVFFKNIIRILINRSVFIRLYHAKNDYPSCILRKNSIFFYFINCMYKTVEFRKNRFSFHTSCA